MGRPVRKPQPGGERVESVRLLLDEAPGQLERVGAGWRRKRQAETGSLRGEHPRSKLPMLWPTSIAPPANARKSAMALCGGRPSRASRPSDSPWMPSDAPTGTPGCAK